MALFKIFKGSNSAKILDSTAEGYLPITDGYCYFDTNTGLFYIDSDSKRAPINAYKAIKDDQDNIIADTYIVKPTNQPNKMAWTNNDSKLTFDNHYVDSTSIAINTTNKPSTNFYVQGSSTLNGTIIVGEGSYGDTLPENSTEGQIFFQTGNVQRELPSGGTTGYALVKTSESDYDVSWKKVSLDSVEMATKVSHKLTIGSFSFDGSEDITIPIYDGLYE